MLIQLLQALYEESELPSIESEADLEVLYQDIELFAMASQVYHLLKQSDRWGEVPVSFQERLKARYTQALYHNLFMKHKEEEILKAFEQAECPVIPLKGIHFAERFFGHFAARVTSDIDLFVPYSLMSMARPCIEAQGYEFEILKDHHARFHKGSSMIELHWTLDKLQWSELDAGPFWESAVALPPYQYVRDLSVLHTFYFICLHGARHYMESVRYVVDIAQMLYKHGKDIDLRRLMELATGDKTARRMKVVLSIVYEQFPGLQQLHPLPFQTIDCPWDYNTIREARKGIKSPPYYKYRLFFRHFMFDTWKHRLISLKKAY